MLPAGWQVFGFLPGLVVEVCTNIWNGNLNKQFPPHISHLPEQFGLFTILVLDESFVGAVNGALEYAPSWIYLHMALGGYSLPQVSGGLPLIGCNRCHRCWTTSPGNDERRSYSHLRSPAADFTRVVGAGRSRFAGPHGTHHVVGCRWRLFYGEKDPKA